MLCLSCGQNKSKDDFPNGRHQAICATCRKASRQDICEQTAEVEVALGGAVIYMAVLAVILVSLAIIV